MGMRMDERIAKLEDAEVDDYADRLLGQRGAVDKDVDLEGS